MPRELLQSVGLGEARSRRRFLAEMSVGLSGAIGLLVGVPVVLHLLGPIIHPEEDIWQDLGPMIDFPLGETKLVAFIDPSSLPWAGQTAETAVWVHQFAAGLFDVWAVNCTHLGCPVNWLPDANLFECPCHGGIYYSDGSVAAGPPPRPLFKHQVRLRADRVEALTFRLPTP